MKVRFGLSIGLGSEYGKRLTLESGPGLDCGIRLTLVWFGKGNKAHVRVRVRKGNKAHDRVRVRKWDKFHVRVRK